MKAYALRRIAVAAAVLITGASASRADVIADFYRGKQIMLYIRAAPGGNYDVYSRALASYLTKYLPGNPIVLPINMPGGGGLVALNYVANIAPKDGTALTMITQSFPMDQALGLDKNLKVDLRTLGWIGNMSDTNEFFFTSKDSPTKTLEDARGRVTPVAATGIGSITTELAALYNNRLGTKFKVIYGYPSGPEMSLAMERGEVEGRSTSNPQVLAPTKAAVMAKYNFLLQTGLAKVADYQDVPLLRDLANNDEDREIFDFVAKGVVIARPFVTNAGVPPERLEALRRAFDASLRDKDFLADAAKLKLEIAATSGEELDRIVHDLLDASPALRQKVAQAIAIQSSAASAQEAKAHKSE
jgi:tripartite-type tricarboxylate transporter receptor subunit TctC